MLVSLLYATMTFVFVSIVLLFLGVMKRAVKWTLTDVDERRPSMGWNSAVWSTSTTRKRQVAKGRLKKAGQRQPVEKGRLVDVNQ